MLKELTPSFFVAKLKFPVTFSYSALEVSLRIYFYRNKVTCHYTHFNPLHTKISMHILHNVLYTFPKVLTRRICLTIMSSFT